MIAGEGKAAVVDVVDSSVTTKEVSTETNVKQIIMDNLPRDTENIKRILSDNHDGNSMHNNNSMDNDDAFLIFYKSSDVIRNKEKRMVSFASSRKKQNNDDCYNDDDEYSIGDSSIGSSFSSFSATSTKIRGNDINNIDNDDNCKLRKKYEGSIQNITILGINNNKSKSISNNKCTLIINGKESSSMIKRGSGSKREIVFINNEDRNAFANTLDALKSIIIDGDSGGGRNVTNHIPHTMTNYNFRKIQSIPEVCGSSDDGGNDNDEKDESYNQNDNLLSKRKQHTTNNCDGKILVEIVSCADLNAADVNGKSDPYCIVKRRDQKKEKQYDGNGSGDGDVVHKTNVIKKQLNPIWTVDTKCFFIIDYDHSDNSDHSDHFDHSSQSKRLSDILSFEIMDADRIKKDEKLGMLELSIYELLSKGGCLDDEKEKRVEYSLSKPNTTDNDASSVERCGGKFKSVMYKIRKFSNKKGNSLDEDKVFDYGTLSLRVRFATASDVAFVDDFCANGSYNPVKKNISTKSIYITPPIPSMGTPATQKKIRQESLLFKKLAKKTNLKYHKVRPCRDPDVTKGGKYYMTTKEIEAETYQLSRCWIESYPGWGKIDDSGGGDSNSTGEEPLLSSSMKKQPVMMVAGRINLEILGCDGLPNLDRSTLDLNDKSDPFVTAILEDSVLVTDVIPRSLSPRFLPWTRRAFVLHPSHASSDLLLGVHDFDSAIGNSKKPGNHDFMGRVRIRSPLLNFRHGLEYILTYELHDTVNVLDRRMMGTITVRISVEPPPSSLLFRDRIQDTISGIYNASVSSERSYVNVDNSNKFFKPILNIVEGTKDIREFSTDTIKMHLNELWGVTRAIAILYNSAMDVLLWRRGVKMFRGYIRVPLHSVTAFVGGIVLVEKPWLLPPMLLISIGWVMLFMLGRRANQPSPWGRPLPYIEAMKEHLSLMILGGNSDKHKDCDKLQWFQSWKASPPNTIKSNEGFKEEIDYIDIEQRLTKTMLKISDWYDDYCEANKDSLEITGDSMDVEDLTMTGRRKLKDRLITSPLRSKLYPHQVLLGQMVMSKRYVANVLNWDHYSLAFAITTFSLFVGGVSILFLPWRLICLWSGRVLVWNWPWMGIIQILSVRWHQAQIEGTPNERRREVTRPLRVQKENSLKLAALKKQVFGEYIVTCPHVTKPEMYNDEPLPQSSAVPKARGDRGGKRIKILGQRLNGMMIPVNINEHCRNIIARVGEEGVVTGEKKKVA